MKQDIKKQLEILKDSFGEPIAVALIVDNNGISIRKARKLGPHMISFDKKNKQMKKIGEFNEEEIDDVNFEALPGYSDKSGSTAYMG